MLGSAELHSKVKRMKRPRSEAREAKATRLLNKREDLAQVQALRDGCDDPSDGL